jgi:hypothetical protein
VRGSAHELLTIPVAQHKTIKSAETLGSLPKSAIIQDLVRSQYATNIGHIIDKGNAFTLTPFISIVIQDGHAKQERQYKLQGPSVGKITRSFYRNNSKRIAAALLRL